VFQYGVNLILVMMESESVCETMGEFGFTMLQLIARDGFIFD
jgi:hypothetical protein